MDIKRIVSVISLFVLLVLNLPAILSGCKSNSTTTITTPGTNTPIVTKSVTTSLPDLIILQSWYEPSSPDTPGTTIKFHLVIKNIGSGEVPSGSFILVTGPGNYSGGFSGGLLPGLTKEVIVDWPVYSKGVTYSNIIWTVDHDNIIKESNDNNNDSQPYVIQTTY